jgi:CHAT domain-containing protein/tetratricopeptide (TPR) repeat protein
LAAAIWARRLGQALASVDRGDEARPLLERALGVSERLAGPNSKETAAALLAIGNLRERDRDLAGALAAYDRALTIRLELAGGKKDLSVAAAMLAKGRALVARQQVSEGKSLFNEVLALREQMLGAEHPLVAQAIDDLGWTLIREGDYAGAERALTRELGILERAYGPDDVRVARPLASLSIVRRHRGEFGEAETLVRRMIGILEQDGSRPLGVAKGLHTLASILKQAGDLEGARDAELRALALSERQLGPEHPDIAFVAAQLGQIELWRGEYARSEMLYRRALRIWEGKLGAEHPLTLTMLGDLALLAQEKGDYEAALTLQRQVLAARERVLGAQHPEVAISLTNLAQVEDKRGEYAVADSLFRRALAIQEEALGADHPNVGETLHNLASVAHSRGDLAKARESYQRALAIQERAFGAEHYNVALILDGLGSVEAEAGNPARARQLFDRALAIQERVLGPSHRWTSRTRLDLARLDLAAGNPDGAWEKSHRVFEEELALWEDLFTLASERQALRIAENLDAARDIMVSAAMTINKKGVGPESQILERTYSSLVRSRGKVLDHLAARHQTVQDLHDPEVRTLAARLARARQRLATLVQTNPDPSHPERYRQQLQLAAAEKEEASGALARGLATRHRQVEPSNAGSKGLFAGMETTRLESMAGGATTGGAAGADLAAITRALPAGAALIEFVRYEHALAGGREQVEDVAWVLSPALGGRSPDHPGSSAAGAVSIKLVSIGRASETDSLILAYRKAIDDAANEVGFRGVANRLHDRLWAPLAPFLPPAPREAARGDEGLVFIVPDASLHLVDFATLTMDGERFLIEERALHRLSSAADLPRLAESRSPEHRTAGEQESDEATLLAVGDPDFELLSADGDKLEEEVSLAFVPMLTREAALPCRDALPPPLKLPGSGRELDELVRLAGPGSRLRLTALRGADAVEARVKQESSRHRILHLATHGYFIQGLCPQEEPVNRSARPGREGAQISVDLANPLLLSGLLLAGASDTAIANMAGTQHQAPEDGFLTAEEIAALDLSGVDLVMLSACESGLGRIEVGEGVFGLSHAFELAGARSVLMSLWRLPDVTMPAFVADLYRELTRRGPGALEIVAALRKAKLAGLRRAETDLLSRHPRYWAGIVACGAWN